MTTLPGVAHSHTIRVQHRDNLEDEELPEALGCLGGTSEVMKHAWF